MAETGWKARTDGTEYEAVRQRLVDATEAIIRERGVGGLRQDEVAERAGLARSSVYRYFDSKEAMVIAAAIQSTLRIGRGIQTRIGPDSDPEEFLVRGIMESLSEMADDPLYRALTEPVSSRAVSRLTTNALREGIRPLVEPMFEAAEQRGVLRAGVSPDDAIRWLQVVALGLIHAPEVVTDPDDLEAMLRQMLVPALIDPSGPAT